MWSNLFDWSIESAPAPSEPCSGFVYINGNMVGLFADVSENVFGYKITIYINIKLTIFQKTSNYLQLDHSDFKLQLIIAF